MVHALTEAYRVLRSGGHVIDYRPDVDSLGHRKDTCCISHARECFVGALVETPTYHADYRAADRAVQQILRRGIFSLVSSEVARPRFYFRDLATLQRYLQTEWTGTTLGANTRGRLSKILRQDPAAQIAVLETVRINVLQKA